MDKSAITCGQCHLLKDATSQAIDINYDQHGYDGCTVTLDI